MRLHDGLDHIIWQASSNGSDQLMCTGSVRYSVAGPAMILSYPG